MCEYHKYLSQNLVCQQDKNLYLIKQNNYTFFWIKLQN